MRILVGVDSEGLFKASLDLLCRLKFSNAHYTLAHAVDPVVPLAAFGYAMEPGVDLNYSQVVAQAGEEVLEAALNDACARDLQANSVLLYGKPASTLIEYGEDEKFDLVVVQSERKGAFGSLFFGSTSRGLAIGSKQSLLVSKGNVAPIGNLSVVFATDHSEFANQALDRFIGMKPEGVKKVHVVSAAWIDDYESFMMRYDLEKLGGSVDIWLEQQLADRNAGVVERLTAAGFDADARVVTGKPSEAIDQTMHHTGSDLLIMGAQGHGFFRRLLIGSVSLHQVVSEPYPVMVIRN